MKVIFKISLIFGFLGLIAPFLVIYGIYSGDLLNKGGIIDKSTTFFPCMYLLWLAPDKNIFAFIIFFIIAILFNFVLYGILVFFICNVLIFIYLITIEIISFIDHLF